MPLAEATRRIAVPLQRLHKRLAILRQSRRVAGKRPGELADHPETDRVMVAPRHQRRTRRRAKRRRVETVVRQPRAGQPVERRSADRPAEPTRIPEARIVGEDQQDVRRTIRGGDRRHIVPVRLRTIERALHHPLKRRTPDRQPASIDRIVAHVPLPYPGDQISTTRRTYSQRANRVHGDPTLSRNGRRDVTPRG